jgi:hypothetical protein
MTNDRAGTATAAPRRAALTPSGSLMFCSIHSDNAMRGGGMSERRALRVMVSMVVMG